MAALFLSDLHLPAEPSPLRQGFLRLLDGPGRDAEAIYLLGDVFEYWIGDDVGLEVYAAEAQALRRLTAAGVRIYFMHGNRDFLVGRRFTQATGVQLLRDPTCIELAGRPVLLSHGDRWCTEDAGYQRWRRFSRNRLAQTLYALLPRSLRLRIAGDLRRRSHRDTGRKAAVILDVNADAIIDAFRSASVPLIIHGHTHRPADHRVDVDGRECRRIVLADWRQPHMEYVVAEGRALRRVTL